jgi:phospholipid-binding lipoprotein MlaA
MMVFKRSLHFFYAALVVLTTQGCATGPNANPVDPMEPLNRAVFGINDGLDRALIKPVATVYDRVVPVPIQTGVGNFFGNISDVWSVANNALQFKPQETLETFLRVSVNTVFGFGGLLDISSEMGIPKHSQDFGQTLGVWGFNAGPYVVLPIFGPSSVRDTVGTVVGTQADVVGNLKRVPVRNSLTALRVLDKRAELLSTTNALDEAALDKYTFARDVYLRRRDASIGKEVIVPEERFDLPAPAAK